MGGASGHGNCQRIAVVLVRMVAYFVDWGYHGSCPTG